MKGSVGTAMGGPSDSRKWAVKRNLKALILAKDILTLKERGEDIYDYTIEACKKAVERPSQLEYPEKRMIYKCWMHFATTGKLRGIRTKPQSQLQ